MTDFISQRRKILEDAFLHEKTMDLLDQSIEYTLSTGNECGFQVYHSRYVVDSLS